MQNILISYSSAENLKLVVLEVSIKWAEYCPAEWTAMAWVSERLN